MIFHYPIHRIDADGIVSQVRKAKGRKVSQEERNAANSQKRKQDLDAIYAAHQPLTLSQLAELLEVSEKTAGRRIKEFCNDYTIENGFIRKK